MGNNQQILKTTRRGCDTKNSPRWLNGTVLGIGLAFVVRGLVA